MKAFAEKHLEKVFIEELLNQGYDYVYGPTIHRKRDEIIIEDDFKSYLLSRYPDLTEEEYKTLFGKLNNLHYSNLYEASRETFYLINEGVDLIREDRNLPVLHVDFIDYEYPENNIMKVVNQYEVQDLELRIPDTMIFINGLPLVLAEEKDLTDENATIHTAYEQIHTRYKRGIPSFMRFIQISIITDGVNAKWGTPYTEFKDYSSWNKIDGIHYSDEDALTKLVMGALNKPTLLAILRDYIYYPDNSDEDVCFLCRYPQYFGSEALLKSIKKGLKPNGDGKGGTLYGAPGIGKSLAILNVARKVFIREPEAFNNPTFVVLVDRDDLQDQSGGIYANAKKYLRDDEVRIIDSRQDLKETLSQRESGGFYIITVQKFNEEIGLLSERSNIICASDEAHRTQLNMEDGIKLKGEELITTKGIGKQIRTAFPNATYFGVTGTPTDDTVKVFGNIVYSYNIQDSKNDGITTGIAYQPRLARVTLNHEDSKKIDEYYKTCSEAGTTKEQIEKSKKAMASISILLNKPERLKLVAKDIVEHYEQSEANHPEVHLKAMILESSRDSARKLLKEIRRLRPEWFEEKRSWKENLTEDEFNSLKPVPKIKMIATRGPNDDKELYDICGDREYRKEMGRLFKDDLSNFSIVIVVDMWTTGFDCNSLGYIYVDKPIRDVNLLQTICRVNRLFEGKEKGIIIDYVGIQQHLFEVMKHYCNLDENQDVIEIEKTTIAIFNNVLSITRNIFPANYFKGFNELEDKKKYKQLLKAAEYIQEKKKRLDLFMFESRRLKAAYRLIYSSDKLNHQDKEEALIYIAVRSIIFKQTHNDAPSVEEMNIEVEKMVDKALKYTEVEEIVDIEKQFDFYNEDFLEKLKETSLPISKFNYLVKILNIAIREYGKKNKVKAYEFDAMLKQVINEYNERDDLVFTSYVVSSFVDELSTKLINIFEKLKKEQNSFEELGLTFEEKVFYDILLKVRDDNGFEYPEERCKELAKKVKVLVDDKSQYVDWSNRQDIKNQLQRDLIKLLNKDGYPPTWSEEIFKRVLEQTENYKKYN